MEYDFISRAYPGWSLTEIKTMPRRERAHWVGISKWRSERMMLHG